MGLGGWIYLIHKNEIKRILYNLMKEKNLPFIIFIFILNSSLNYYDDCSILDLP